MVNKTIELKYATVIIIYLHKHIASLKKTDDNYIIYFFFCELPFYRVFPFFYYIFSLLLTDLHKFLVKVKISHFSFVIIIDIFSIFILLLTLILLFFERKYFICMLSNPSIFSSISVLLNFFMKSFLIYMFCYCVYNFIHLIFFDVCRSQHCLYCNVIILEGNTLSL